MLVFQSTAFTLKPGVAVHSKFTFHAAPPNTSPHPTPLHFTSSHRTVNCVKHLTKYTDQVILNSITVFIMVYFTFYIAILLTLLKIGRKNGKICILQIVCSLSVFSWYIVGEMLTKQKVVYVLDVMLVLL